jgi:AcrR family transcriptional regulator
VGSAAKEREVLDAARRALDRHGWQRLTIERIAEEAGISRVTLHRRGMTKELILGRLAEEATVQYREALWPVLTGADSAGRRLELALFELCGLAERNLSLLLALDAQANDAVFHEADGEEGGEEVMTRSVFTDPLERLLRDGLAEGSVADSVDPTATATLLFNLVGWTYIHLRSGHRWSPERTREATVDVALRGVLVRGTNSD